jgi:hypothetical protein
MNGNIDSVVSFENLMKLANLKSDRLPNTVKLDRDMFLAVVKRLLRGVHVDETWYRSTYEDVDAAIGAGTYQSAKHHFVEDGYFEGRRSGPVAVDETWYRNTYPDVAEGLELGDITSAQEHFDEYGYREGRLPAPY